MRDQARPRPFQSEPRHVQALNLAACAVAACALACTLFDALFAYSFTLGNLIVCVLIALLFGWISQTKARFFISAAVAAVFCLPIWLANPESEGLFSQLREFFIGFFRFLGNAARLHTVPQHGGYGAMIIILLAAVCAAAAVILLLRLKKPVLAGVAGIAYYAVMYFLGFWQRTDEARLYISLGVYIAVCLYFRLRAIYAKNPPKSGYAAFQLSRLPIYIVPILIAVLLIQSGFFYRNDDFAGFVDDSTRFVQTEFSRSGIGQAITRLFAPGLMRSSVVRLGGNRSETSALMFNIVNSEEELYLRTSAFDTYNGRSWTKTAGDNRYDFGTGEYWVASGFSPQLDSSWLTQLHFDAKTIASYGYYPYCLMTDIRPGLNYIFAPTGLLAAEVGGVLQSENIYVNDFGEVFYRDPPAEVGDMWLLYAGPSELDKIQAIISEYERTSGVPFPLERPTLELGLAPFDWYGVEQWAEYRSYINIYEYLQLPEQLPKRVRQLAVEVSGAQDGAIDVLDAVTNIRDYLKNNFTYTREPKRARSLDFVDGFLFETKEGYCTYFASSLVVMCRSLGIPARYVEGFYVARAHTEKFPVTNKMMHAWAEVFIPPVGWITVDGTAGDPTGQRTPPPSSGGTQSRPEDDIDRDRPDPRPPNPNTPNTSVQTPDVPDEKPPTFFDSKTFQFLRRWATFFAIVVPIAAYWTWRDTSMKRAHKRYEEQGTAEDCRAMYAEILRMCPLIKHRKAETITPKEFFDYLLSKKYYAFLMPDVQLMYKRAAHAVDVSIYGLDQPDLQDSRALNNVYKEISDRVGFVLFHKALHVLWWRSGSSLKTDRTTLLRRFF